MRTRDNTRQRNVRGFDTWRETENGERKERKERKERGEEREREREREAREILGDLHNIIPITGGFKSV